MESRTCAGKRVCGNQIEGLQFTDLCSCTELVHDVKCNPFCSRFDLELKQCVRIDVQTEKRLHFQSLCNAFAEATWCEYV